MIAGHRVTDIHVHIQPWEMHPSPVQHAMEAGRTDLDLIQAFRDSPKAFLDYLDACGIERAALTIDAGVATELLEALRVERRVAEAAGAPA